MVPSRLALPGAVTNSNGVTFRLHAPRAEAVELCLFEAVDSSHETERRPMDKSPGGSWICEVAAVGPGQLYGYRVHGPWEPQLGDRFNAAKLLIDPFAAAIAGRVEWHAALADTQPGSDDLVPSLIDTSPLVPKAVVVDRQFDWQGDRPPGIQWSDTLIYECHVKGLTQLHPEVPEEHRGTYLGIGHPAVVGHLQSLGITAVELLPVQHHISEQPLVRRGLTNYFGYNPIGWIAPHGDYATDDRGAQVVEFKSMVRALHRAGIEVLLDVVFNHSAEGNHLGPVLSLRGIDNRAYYRLEPEDRRRYENYSGCGNTLDFGHPAAVELTLAALRYWVEEMHVDGFRFDLATSLARDPNAFNPTSAFLEGVRTDPVLANVKLIAEPWDVGPGGYSLGGFPRPWREWNDRFRDTIRHLWRGDPVPARELTSRLDGSTDLVTAPTDGRSASVNFVTCHDGYTLEDLVTFEQRHNSANGENNRDGHQHNLSCNWGVEGPTDVPEIRSLRLQAKRNFVATLSFATGVPMIGHGDELGRSQSGNNNAYCHDSPLTWIDWRLDAEATGFLEFVRQALSLRRRLGALLDQPGSWLSAHAEPLTARALSMARTPPLGRFWHTETAVFLMVVNSDARGHLFELPGIERRGHWHLVLGTDRPQQRRLRGHAVRVAPRSLLLLEYILSPPRTRTGPASSESMQK